MNEHISMRGNVCVHVCVCLSIRYYCQETQDKNWHKLCFDKIYHVQATNEVAMHFIASAIIYIYTKKYTYIYI